MNSSDKFLFSLIGNALFDAELDPNAEYSWQEVFAELTSQAAAAIPADKVGQLRLTGEEREQYSVYVISQVMNWNRVMYTQQMITDALKEASVPAAVLKGAAAGIYYPRPEYRCMGDIDLIVLPEDFPRAVEVLKKAGCRQQNSKNERHEIFIIYGVHIELHHYFSSLQDSPVFAKYLDERIYNGLSHVQYGEIEGIRFPMLPEVENGLVLLQHISQHLETGLGLRQIMDWMLYVNTVLDDGLWEREFEKAAERSGLKTLAVVTTRMCRMFLGLPGTYTWCEDADPFLCRDLMTYVMNHGNFGRKDTAGSTTKFLLNSFRNPIAFLRMAQRCGCATWEILDQYSFLRPFAWVHQIIRWMRRGSRRKSFLPSLFRDIRKAGAEDRFLDKLGVRRGKNLR